MRSTLTLVTVLLFGCQTAPEVKKELNIAGPAVPLLSLERTACYGSCPVYSVQVLTDGTTVFKGEQNVKVTEPVEVKLEASTLSKLTAVMDASAFAKWADFTREPMSDLPSAVLTYKGHTVRHYLGDDQAPAALTRLEDDVDLIIGTARWVKGVGTETK